MVRREMESGSEYGVGSRQADAFGSLDFRDSDFLRISDFEFRIYSLVCMRSLFFIWTRDSPRHFLTRG